MSRLLSCSALVLVFATANAAAAPDGIEGYWLGTVGTDKEKVEVGFEFRRDPSGTLTMKITQPIMGYYGVDAGEARQDGDRVTNEPFALSLTQKGDALSGTFPGPRSAATLRRVESLPQPAPIPDVPTGPAPRWQTRLNGQVFASPTVADGIVYIGTTGGVMTAVNAATGEFVWTFGAGAPIFGAAVISDGVLYFACDDGFLYALDVASGKQRWRSELGGRTARILPHPATFEWDWQAPAPLVADGVVYVGAGDGGFHAIDAVSGTRKWRFETKGRIRNGAAIDGDRVVVGSADHFVYSIDRTSGREIWKADTRAEVDGAPLVANGRVFIGNRGVGLFALESDTGKEAWRLFFWGSWVESTPTIRHGVLYIGSSDLGHVSAIDPADGRVIWRGNVYGWTFGTPLATDERIYAGAAGGTPYFIRHDAGFVTLDRKTGRMLTRWPFADTGGHQWGIAGSPARSGDSVIVATIAGSLFAFPLQ